MAIGERIHFFRTMRGMTQKYLGMALGFPEKSADVRLAQYENGSRTPKADVTAALAQALDVSPKALDVPDIDSYVGLMHTLFTLEDRYGLEVCECEDEVHLRVHIHKGRDAAELHRMLAAWGAAAAKLKAGEITKEEYDRWRYRYPELDTSGQWHKITPSQSLVICSLPTSKNIAKNNKRLCRPSFTESQQSLFRSQYRIGCDSKPANHSLAKIRTNKMALVSAIILLSNEE